MAPFVDEKIGGYLYKLKLPEKAVDIMIHTVLLENGQVWEMPYIDGTMSQKKWQDVVDLILRPLKHIKSLSGVVKIADRVALIESGDIYRWGDIYNIGREWFHLSLNVEIPVFVYKAQKNISFFSKKARGSMARFIIKNKIIDHSEINNFNYGKKKYFSCSSPPR